MLFRSVELDEGPRVMTNIEGVAPDGVEIGMRVTVAYREISDEITIPVFRPAAA